MRCASSTWEDRIGRPAAGTVAVIVGAPRAGKSRVALALAAPRVRAAGHPVPGLRRMARRWTNRGGDDPMVDYLSPDATAYANLRRIARLCGTSATNIDPILRRLGLRDASAQKVRDLAPGVVRRLRIAAALLPMPDLVVLDDAFEDLQETERQLITTLVADLADAGCAVVLTTTQIADALPIADRVLVVLDDTVSLDCQASELARAVSGVRAYPARPSDTSRIVDVANGLRARATVRPDRSVSIHGTLELAAELTHRLAEHKVALRALLPETRIAS